MARKRKTDEEDTTNTADAGTKEKEAPITTGEPTEENPSGIESVSEEAATSLGQSRDTGGSGAAGATVAGPVTHVATEGGTKPLPIPESQKVEEKDAEKDKEEPDND